MSYITEIQGAVVVCHILLIQGAVMVVTMSRRGRDHMVV